MISKPNNIQIELVEGCNRMCDFCGIHSIWKNKEDRKIKYMSLEMVNNITASLKEWDFNKKRIEFAMHGEPTMHRKLFDVLKTFRKELSLAQLQLTTNGIVLLKEGRKYVEELFFSGLNILMVDAYVKRKELIELMHSVPNITVQNFYDAEATNPYYYKGNKHKVILIIDDLGIMSGIKTQRKILNHAGNSDSEVLLKKYNILPVVCPLVKRCSRPFREMVIHQDGTVPICCLDWKHEAIMGKFPEDGSLETIWNSLAFNTIRRRLFDKKRFTRPCYCCDYNGGFRLGLLKLDDYEFVDFDIKKHYIQYQKYCHPSVANSIFYNKNSNKGVYNYLLKREK